jgi:hypothetical protein
MQFSAKYMNRQACFPSNIYIANGALEISINISSVDHLARCKYSLLVV